MLTRMQAHTESDDELIARYLKPNPYKPGRANWRLVESGMATRAFAGLLEGAKGDLAYIADGWGLSPAQIDAAIAFYERYRDIVDDRRIANDAFDWPE